MSRPKDVQSTDASKKGTIINLNSKLITLIDVCFCSRKDSVRRDMMGMEDDKFFIKLKVWVNLL